MKNNAKVVWDLMMTTDDETESSREEDDLCRMMMRGSMGRYMAKRNNKRSEL